MSVNKRQDDDVDDNKDSKRETLIAVINESSHTEILTPSKTKIMISTL